MTGDSSDETCQFRDLALALVADMVYARPSVYYKNQSMLQNGSLVSGLSVTPSLVFNYFTNVLICPIFTNCS